jgi:acetylornithine deacetylase
MLAAFLRLVREKPAGAANVVLSCTCDEEATQLGVLELVKLWNQAAPHPILGSRPIAAIVAEPTGLDIITAHRGATRWKIRTNGRACHSSDPSQGTNAIYRMMPVVAALEEYAAGLGSRRRPHPLCGPATLSVGVIHGGQAVNIVPDRCEIEIDRRTIPGENPLQAMREVNDFLRSRAGDSFEALPSWIAAPPLPDGENDAVAQSLLATVQSHCGPRQLRGVAYGTNASTIAAVGVPSIVFGPGSIAQAHTIDEWLPIDELELAAEILFNFATRFGR